MPQIIAGPGSGVYKYDVLTALSAAALRDGPVAQVSALRLIALITARYNWQRNEVSIGQRDLARLWGVTERTVKREMKRLGTAGLLVCTRPGVRGRVGAYRLDFDAVAQASAAIWPEVGPDFEARAVAHSVAHGAASRPAETVVRVDFSARGTPPAAPVPAPEGQGAAPGAWEAVAARLRAEHPEAWANWFARLRPVEGAPGQVVLEAPSGFVCRYVETHLGGVLAAAVRVVCGAEADLVLTVKG